MLRSSAGAMPKDTSAPPSKRSVSLYRRSLLILLQSLNFGRIEGLVIQDSEPVLEPPPRCIRAVKFGGENGPRPEVETGDFLLKAQVVELFSQLDQLRNATIEVLEVKHGLPFRMDVEVCAA